jgi:hypothetical protein
MQRTLALAVILMATGRVCANPPDDAGIEFFEKKIRPVLVEHCYECHSSQSKKKRGELLLDSRAGVRKGGESGPVIVPGKPQESLLIKAIRHVDPELKMPPNGKLPEAVIADLEAWIKMGAPDPRDKATPAVAGANWAEMLHDRRSWWSLQPVRRPALPRVKNAAWSDHPVDQFILAKLEDKGLTPVGPADARTLVRRLSLVLTGLPPTPAEVDAFLEDNAPKAVERLVDRLLASPHFGERWARHWMDVVRFSETHGNEWNYDVHHAWRYRDYLIRAFNDDVPYDQLVREHIAGDLLPLAPAGAEGRVSGTTRWNQKQGVNESVIGTAFYRFGEVNHDDCIGLRQIGYDLADNQIDTLSKAFQATTVACARCHDHKLDAVSMKDYYALLGVLRSSRQVSHTIDGPDVNTKAIARLLEVKQQIREELGILWMKQSEVLKPADLGPSKGLPQAAIDQPKWDDPLEPWRILAARSATPASFEAEWRRLAGAFALEAKERDRLAGQVTTFADFGDGFAGWQHNGHGLRQGPVKNGDCVIALDGPKAVQSVLPRGAFTHALSDRLNGTLRSPILPAGKKYISFQVMGQKQSAVRLVSNGCQLNYRNYRALTKDKLQWITFPIPEDCDNLRVYAELMTKFDNPKFPDQLGTLGGDTVNHRVPWEQAAKDAHSYFGVTKVVLHDEPLALKEDIGYVQALFAGEAPQSLDELAKRYGEVTYAAVRRWIKGNADAEDARWLDGLLQAKVLTNDLERTPRLEKLVKEYRQTESTLSLPRIVPGVADFGPGLEQPVFVRGDCMKPGDKVARRYLEVLAGTEAHFTSPGSGRLELADRIADPRNPLTARVMVNRIWHHLFGTGLVRTVDDFGRVGELPSHPELLDYFAARFVEDGWSIKRLIRTLVLTRTFQMTNRPSAEGRAKDPENRLLHHYPARRMEAEAIRDSILAASGRLDRTLYGLSIASWREKENADRRLFVGPLDGHGRRSIYIKNTLMEPPRFLDVFDFPGGKVTQGRRHVTNVPAQALGLLNDPFVLQQADVWATQLMARRDESIAPRIAHMFFVALGRPPAKDEETRFVEAVRQLAELHQMPREQILTSQVIWKDLAHAMYNLKEFIYIP